MEKEKEKVKYYQPTIEEFYPGFEFEFRPMLRNGLIPYIRGDHDFSDIWQQAIYYDLRGEDLPILRTQNIPTNIDDIQLFIDHDAVRVKYFSHDDIESFDIHYIPSDKIWYREINGDTIYVKYIKGQIYDISILLAEEESSLYYKGMIKNKSEFRRILTQLGINPSE